MKKYDTQEVTKQVEVLVEYRCDGCGITEDEAYPEGLMEVAIEVGLDECAGGKRDEYDYCNSCLIDRADLLVAAGSRSELVTGPQGE